MMRGVLASCGRRVPKTFSMTSTVVNGSELNGFNVVTIDGTICTFTVSGGGITEVVTSNTPTFTFTGATGEVTITVDNPDKVMILESFSNSLTSLDVSKCVSLFLLDCHSNSLTSLNVSKCVSLQVLDCHSNSLTSLDFSTCISLSGLDCKSNSLTSTSKDSVYIDIDTNGVTNGSLNIDSGRTSASNTARANLITKNWNITD